MIRVELKNGQHYRYNFKYGRGPDGELEESWTLHSHIEEWLSSQGIQCEQVVDEFINCGSWSGEAFVDTTLFLEFANPSDATLFKLTWA